MDLDILLHHYFGTTAVETLHDAALALGMETDPGRRFGLWAVLHALDRAPAPGMVFEDAGVRRAAEDYARVAERMAGEQGFQA